MGERKHRRRRGRHKGPPIPPPPPGQEVGAEVEVVIDAIAPKGDGVGPLGEKLAYAARTVAGAYSRYWEPYLTISLMYWMLTLLLAWGVRRLEARYGRGDSR